MALTMRVCSGRFRLKGFQAICQAVSHFLHTLPLVRNPTPLTASVGCRSAAMAKWRLLFEPSKICWCTCSESQLWKQRAWHSRSQIDGKVIVNQAWGKNGSLKSQVYCGTARSSCIGTVGYTAAGHRIPAQKWGRTTPSFSLTGEEIHVLCARESCSTLCSVKFATGRLCQYNTTSQVLTRIVPSRKEQF